MGQIVEDRVYDPKSPSSQVTLVYAHPLPNSPTHVLLTVRVLMPPGSMTPPHTHNGASVAAIMLRGAVFNKMNAEPTQILRAAAAAAASSDQHTTTSTSSGGAQAQAKGETDTWFEAPGCHHVTSANASAPVGGGERFGVAEGQEAEFLATLVMDRKIWEEQGMGGIVVVDEEYR